MINVTHLRKGTVFTYKNSLLKVLDYKHIKSARGSATIRTKVKNLVNGSIKDITFGNNEKVEEANIRYKKLLYLYCDDTFAYFMDNKTYEQPQIPIKLLGEKKDLLKESMEISVLYHENAPLEVVLPKKAVYKVTYTEPGHAGNTSANALKDAQIETGVTIKVPLFIKAGDEIIINTETKQYSERKKQSS